MLAMLATTRRWLLTKIGMKVLQARCPRCDVTVPVMAIGTLAEVKTALAHGSDIEVMHPTASFGDHRWKLNSEDRANLSKNVANIRET
jgi:hypothetical protein